MATKWIILAAILSLALGVVLGDNKKQPEEKGQEQATPKTECCDLSKALPLAVTEPPKECIENGDKQNSKDDSAKGGNACKAECILGSLKLLNEDKSIKVPEAKKAVLDNVHPDAKKVVEEAIDKCLKNYSNDKSNSRKSAKELYECVFSAVKLNCPKTLWLNTKPECKAMMEKP